MLEDLVRKLFDEKITRRQFIVRSTSATASAAAMAALGTDSPPFYFLRMIEDSTGSPKIGEPVEGFSFPKPESRNNPILILKPESYEESLLFSSFQGLENRKDSKIYLNYSNSGDLSEYRWLNSLDGVKKIEIRHPFKLIKSHKRNFNGYVVWDPDLRSTVNVATTISGQKNLLIAAPSQEGVLEELGISKKEDLRNRGWGSNFDVNNWAIENLLRDSNPYLIASLDPEMTKLRDYLIMGNVFTFNLDPFPITRIPFLSHLFPSLNEHDLFKKLLENTKSNIGILGFWTNQSMANILSSMMKFVKKDAEYPWTEYFFVKLVSSYGNFVVPSSEIENLSLFSYSEPFQLKQAVSNAKYDSEKKYLTFVFSDGDNLGYVNDQMHKLWNDENRGKIALGWSMSPSLVDVAPSIIKYYYATATPKDRIVASPSGIGYHYPNVNPHLDHNLEITSSQMQKADMHEVWVLNDIIQEIFDDYNPFGHSEPGIMKKYAEKIENLNGILARYWHLSEQSSYYMVGDKPVIQSLPAFFFGESSDTIYDRIKKSHNKFTFVALNANKTSPSDVVKITQRLDGNYDVVRPDDLMKFITYHENGTSI